MQLMNVHLVDHLFFSPSHQSAHRSVGVGDGGRDGGGGLGEGGGGAGDGGLGGGIGGGVGGFGGGGEGEGGGGGEGSPQQASLHFAESLLPSHNCVHLFFLFFLPHAFSTFFLSFFLHVFLSVSASQFFGDSVTLPPIGAESIFRASASGALNGATA